MIPGVGAMESTPICLLDTHSEVFAPEIPAEINIEVRLLWIYEIKELASHWESVAELIRQCANWLRDL